MTWDLDALQKRDQCGWHRPRPEGQSHSSWWERRSHLSGFPECQRGRLEASGRAHARDAHLMRVRTWPPPAVASASLSSSSCPPRAFRVLGGART